MRKEAPESQQALIMPIGAKRSEEKKEHAREMASQQELLEQILSRLAAIEKAVEYIANPLAQVKAEELGTLLGQAMAVGDKARVREIRRMISGG